MILLLILGYTTLQYSSFNTFRTVSYVWGALRRYFPEDAVSTIKGITMTKDEKGAVFDVEDKYLPLFEDYMKEHGNRSQFSICTELPELKERELFGPFEPMICREAPSGRGGRDMHGGRNGRGGQGSYGGNWGSRDKRDNRSYGGNRSGNGSRFNRSSF